MAAVIIHKNTRYLNTQQIEKLLIIFSKLDSILALTQENLASQSQVVIYDALWVASDLVQDAQNLCHTYH